MYKNITRTIPLTTGNSRVALPKSPVFRPHYVTKIVITMSLEFIFH